MEKSVDHFAENTEALKTAQQQLQKYKRKFLHGEFETLSTVVPAYSTADDATREWVHGAMAGIGKSYKVQNQRECDIHVQLPAWGKQPL